MANLTDTTHEDCFQATCTCTQPKETHGSSPAHLAYTSLSAALSAAVFAERNLAGSAPSDVEHLLLVNASDAAICSAMTAARTAAGVAILQAGDQALVFSAQLINFGLEMESGTDREAFLHCLTSCGKYWSAHDNPNHTHDAIRDAVAQLINLSNLLYGTSLGDMSAVLDPTSDLDDSSPLMDFAA